MPIHADKQQKDNIQRVDSHFTQQNNSPSPFQFIDNRPEAHQLKAIEQMVNNSPQAQYLESLQRMADNSPQAKKMQAIQRMVNNSPQAQYLQSLQRMADEHAAKNPLIQRKENKTGLPDNLKSGIENLSGHSMDDVNVHYNSAKPAQLNAHAYAQGTDIHLGAGQEKHLPHEAWHVVQQKQGRVKPTMQMQGVNVNDDTGLEKEADVMGGKALRTNLGESPFQLKRTRNNAVAQRIRITLIYGDVVNSGYVASIETDDVQTQTLIKQLSHPNLAETSKAEIRKVLMNREATGINIDESELGNSLSVQQNSNESSLLEKTRKHVIKQLNIILKYTTDKGSLIYTIAYKLMEAVKNKDNYKIPGTNRGNMIAESVHGRYINCYSLFFDANTSDQKRRENIIHETSHFVFGIPDYSYMWNRVFSYLTDKEHENNPDSIVRLINQTLGLDNIENPSGMGFEDGNTGEQSIDENKQLIANSLNQAAAVLGDVLYHLTVSNNTGLENQFKEQSKYLEAIKYCLKILNLYKGVLRTKPMLLKYNTNALSFQLNDTQSILIFNLKKGLTSNSINKLNGGTISFKIIWFIYQIIGNASLAKLISAWLKKTFNAKRQGSESHLQGKYPQILLSWSKEADL